MDKIVVPLSNGYRLIAERNTGEFDKEIYVGIEQEDGKYFQDLAIIRPTYTFDEYNVKFNSDSFEILAFGDADIEDYTHKFVVPLHEDEE